MGLTPRKRLKKFISSLGAGKIVDVESVTKRLVRAYCCSCESVGKECKRRNYSGWVGDFKDTYHNGLTECFSDDRLVNGCIYCGGPEDTREHVPSKILLEKPFPTNLPIMRACLSCNNGFSQDEEYVACLIECMVAGSTNPRDIKNTRIANILTRKPSLLARIENAKYSSNNNVLFAVEKERLVNVIIKLAVGHAAYELSTVLRHQPTSVNYWLFYNMTEIEKDSYDSDHVIDIFGEVGTRGMQRLLVTEMTDGERYLQLDSYGSKQRQVPGKKANASDLTQTLLPT